VKVAFLGTRGVPARYGGFETAVEEIARRFIEQGIEPLVYCRNSVDRPAEHDGIHLVHLPAIHRRSLETLSHTFLSVLHLMRHPVDAVLLFNGANSVFVPLLRARGMPTAVHVDGLEWERSKWSRWGRQWHRFGERAAVRFGSAVIADAPGIARYYRERHGAETVEVTYGAPVLRDVGDDRLAALDLEPGGYHLVVARLVPENHVDVIVDGYLRSSAGLPLVVVGGATYGAAHLEDIRRCAADDPRVHLIGAVWDQEELNQLYANARTYLHGHSVGGTNPSLLRAMGAGAAVIAWDVEFNRDVLRTHGSYFSDADQLAVELERAEADATWACVAGEAARAHVETHFRWDDVASGYADLCRSLVSGTVISPRQWSGPAWGKARLGASALRHGRRSRGRHRTALPSS
jgi:glycosyltransferase involved in cell wall biosynthesis